MDVGIPILALAFLAMLVIELTPRAWRAAGGGVLILLTLAAIALQLLGVA